MALTGTAVIPPGDFLVHAREWTGLSTVQLLGLMRGASVISGGDSPQYAALVTAYEIEEVFDEDIIDRDDRDDPDDRPLSSEGSVR